MVSIHCESYLDWFYTTGMSEYGLPELEMRNVPAFLEEAVKEVLMDICEELLDKCPPLQITDWLSFAEPDISSANTIFVFRRSTPIPGHEEHYRAERWEVISVGASVRQQDNYM